MIAYQTAAFAYQGSGEFAYQGDGVTPVVVVTQQRGGGTSKRLKSLPQYYSCLPVDKEIQLPAEPEAHQVAVEVLDQACELYDSDDFDEALLEMAQLQRIVAIHIESRQIYNVIEEIKARIQAKKDAEIGSLIRASVEEEDEVKELMELL